jgi:hypothetical protein
MRHRGVLENPFLGVRLVCGLPQAAATQRPTVTILYCREEAMGWMGSNLVASSPGTRGGCKPRAGTRGHGVAVFPARPPQSFGGFGQLGAAAVG